MRHIIVETTNSLPEYSSEIQASILQYIPEQLIVKRYLAALINGQAIDEATYLSDSELFETDNVSIVNKQLASIQNGVKIFKFLTLGGWFLILVLTLLIALLPKGIKRKAKSIGKAFMYAAITSLVTGIILVVIVL